MNDNLTIYVTYHKPEQVQQYELDRLTTPFTLFNVNDNPKGEHINPLNFTFSEMVTMYYVWKNNLYSPFIGFNHYRRLFDQIKLPDENSCQIFRTYNFNVYSQYSTAHNINDLDIALNIIDNIYGQDNPYTKDIKTSNLLIGNCCFIMTWENFIKLSEFLFPILFELDRQLGCSLDQTNYLNRYKHDAYQARVISFIAERLISAWIKTHLKYYL